MLFIRSSVNDEDRSAFISLPAREFSRVLGGLLFAA